MRRTVSHFHQSPKATAVLKDKIVLLNIEGPEKLIMDVSMRWNSIFNMLERYALIQPGIMAALMSKKLERIYRMWYHYQKKMSAMWKRL